MIPKNAATSLFQKTSKTPIMLAMPEVTVITWSGPAYSANNSKCMNAPWVVTKLAAPHCTVILSEPLAQVLPDKTEALMVAVLGVLPKVARPFVVVEKVTTD